MKQKPSLLAVASASLLFLAPQLVVVQPAKADVLPAIHPLKDATWDASGSAPYDDPADSNYVGKSKSATFGVQKTAIQFKLPDSISGTIKKATLRIHINKVNDEDPASDPYVSVYGSSDDSWTSTFPLGASDPALYDHVGGLVAGWQEFVVTDYVKSQLTDKVATFALLGNDSGIRLEFLVDSDTSAFPPELVLEVGAPDSIAPSIASATLAEDSTSGPIFVTPNSSDTTAVTDFKITQIVGGRLYKSDGTTEIVDGNFITKAEGASGLIFKPTADKNSNAGDSFSFKAQAAQDATGTGLSPAMSASITVTQVNDAPVANDDLNVATVDENSGPVTIPYTQLTNNDSKGPSNENTQTLTVDSVTALLGGTVSTDGTNVIFTPAHNFHGTASFQYKVRDNGTTGSGSDPITSSNSATVTLTINARADQPTVTDASTAEDVQTTSGLVITPGSGSGAATTHFKITGITGGTLYKTDGTTPIAEGSFITVAEGGAGLKFTPNADANGTTGFGFQVQAAPGTDNTKLSDPVTVTIPVAEVNDPPVATDDVLSEIQEDSGAIRIPLAVVKSNDNAGADNESSQTLTVSLVDGSAIGGAVTVDGEDLVFTPNPNFYGTASFQYRLEDNGTPLPESTTATVSIPVAPVADIPSVSPGLTTDEDTPLTGIQISPNTVDNSGVTNYLVSSITGGTLRKNDGTPITNGSYITASEGLAGLKFEPNANANSNAGDTFSFQVQAALDGNGKGLSDAKVVSITVNQVNDQPDAVDDTLSDILEDSGPRTISFADLLGNDTKGAGNESGQHLTITPTGTATGGTVTSDGTKLIFTPDANYSGAASFEYQLEDDGEPVHEQDIATVRFNISPVADLPSISGASTQEDEQTSSGLQITANTDDGTTVQYFKIGEIRGGKLYKNDGSFELHQGDFITSAEGGAGLKFTPAENANDAVGDEFSVEVQAALTQSDTGLSGPVKAVIHVSEVNDMPNVNGETLSAVEENAGEQVISVDQLLDNDKPGPTNESGQTITITAVDHAVGGTVHLDDSKTHVIFLPTQDYNGPASFEYTVSDDGNNSPATATATASFTISPRALVPTVTSASTDEDTQTATGLVITPTSGGATTTHFKISGIQGGTLYQHDGLTLINNGDFITVAEGGAGLKFTPNADAHGTTGFGFSVQAAPGTDGSLLSDVVPVSITVTEVNDAPKSELDTLPNVAKGTPKVTIPFTDLTGNDVAGPADEQVSQTLTIVGVSGAVGGQVAIVDGHVEFMPGPDFMGTASFTYTLSDGDKTDTSIAQFDIVDEDQPTITLNGDDTLYMLQGQAYVELGYSAYDEVDHDLTDHVTVTGTVDTSTLGTYELHYNVQDTSNNAASQKTRTVHVVSSDLSALSVGTDGLTPAFQPGTQAYTLKVPSNVKDLNITATPEDPTATLTINGVAKGHGGTQPVALKVGDNEITIVVTAQGGTTKTYTLTVTRHSTPTNPGNGNGNGPKTRQAKVVTGDITDANTVQVDVTRTTEANGKQVDSVSLKGTKVDEVLAKATADGADTARIVIDDLPNDPADEVGVNVSSESLRKLKGADLGLVIEASGTRITVPFDTLVQLSDGGKDLYFRVVPIRKQDETKQVKDRVLDAQELQQYAHGNNVRAVGQPMTIETNFTNRKTKVMFPLIGIDIPTDPQARAAFLSGLAMFIEHSDGQKEVETGQLVYDEAGKPIGLEIGVEKFSTFTFISTDADFKTYLHYISGYPDGTFRPAGNVTRAEIASMIARQMELSQSASAGRYSDLSATHWAAKAVLQLTAAGILSGDVNGAFRPEQSVTRAELAVIAAKLKGLNLSETHNAFPDAQSHWASAAIAAVQQAGLMLGYEDGTFRPNQKLTRAEAVIVLNKLFERPLLKDQQLATWPDVTLSDSASADIESASHDFRVYKDGSITITDVKKPNE